MTKQFSLEEVKKHNDNKSTYIVIHNNVFDVTPFLNEVSDNFDILRHTQIYCIYLRLNYTVLRCTMISVLFRSYQNIDVISKLP